MPEYEYQVIYFFQQDEVIKLTEFGREGYQVVGTNDTLAILQREKPASPDKIVNFSVDTTNFEIKNINVVNTLNSAEFMGALRRFIAEFLLQKEARAIARAEKGKSGDGPFLGNLAEAIISEERRVVSPEGSMAGIDNEEDEED